ncbi:NACHT, LRR and PYD domains-containing protein 12-like [Gastrophryne carolinensis]
MAASAVKDFKPKYLAKVKDCFQALKATVTGLERSYPRLRPLQINNGETDTIPFSGTLLERAEVARSPGHYSPRRVQDLFSPDDSGFVPQTLVLIGGPGTGKTSISHKILADWASGSLFADRFNLVLRVTGREINEMEENVDLPGLVSRAGKLEAPEDAVRALFSEPSKVLLIIDGFEELRWCLEDDYAEWEEPFQSTHKETFLRCLLSREVLADMSLLITSRTASLRKMKDLLQSPSFIELPGFQHNDLQDYFQAEEAAALPVLKENPALSALCSAPLTCWLVGTILKAGLKKDLSAASCKTLSTVYLLYLKSLLKGSQPIGSCLRRVCALANEGVLNQRFLFEEAELVRHGLASLEVASVLRRDPESASAYSFVHGSVQEFLAALYYVLGEEAEIKEVGGAKGDTYLPRVCGGKSLWDLAEERPHLLPAVRFLFGLINNQHLPEVAGAAGCSASSRPKAAIENWLLAGRRGRYNPDALACFYEAQDEELRARAFSAKDLGLEQCFYSGAMENIPTRELLYCTAGHGYRSLALEDFLMRPADLAALAPLFHGAAKLSFTRCGFAEDPEGGGASSWLSNPKSQIKELEFHVCVVAPPFFQEVGALLSSSQSLAKLSVTHHILEDSAMKSLCDGLRHPECPLQELVLDDCNLTPSSCRELGSALKVARSLQKLDMALNKIEDDGVRFLCEGVKDPGCTLKELRIDFSELTSGCCEDLRSLLMANRSLQTLSFRDNNFEDAGAKLICEGLRHPGCPLKELRLNECNISGSSCDDFRSVLLANHTLSILDLTYNHLEDAGVKVLCQALRDPACTLQELILLHCELGPASCEDLAAVITANRSLTKLDLTWNTIEDSGAKVLCEALKSPSCSLQELRLYGCELTSCEELAAAISANRSLTKLDLSGNQFGDSGIKPLCQALRSPSCALQEIRVGYCNMTAMCAEEFLAVINTNPALTEVDVSFNVDEVEPSADTESLCKRFEHPACTLERNETQDGTFVYFKYSKKK